MLKYSLVRICAYGIPKMSDHPSSIAFATKARDIADRFRTRAIKKQAPLNGEAWETKIEVKPTETSYFKMKVDKIWYPIDEKPSCNYFDPKSVRIFLQNEFGIAKSRLLDQKRKKLINAKGYNNPILSWVNAKRFTHEISEGVDFYHQKQTERRSVEHVLPQSFVNYLPELTQDLVMLRTINFNFNCKRKNLPYGNMDTQETVMRNGVCYVKNDIKGELSRMILYAFIMYEQTLSNLNFNFDAVGRLEMFIEWCLQYIPTDSELIINGKIEKMQGNRNPLVDDIELCKAAYGLR